MKNILTTIIILSSTFMFAQEGVDIITPQQSPFNSGQNIEGWVQGSINEPTGKVAFSVPLASVNARNVSYQVALGYNGQSAFDIGSYTNKYAPTSTVGVGFNLFVPKIVVDNKNTATKEDDTFYLQDGASNSKLHCINRINPGNFEGKEIWEFEAQKYTPWKIQYYKSENYFITVNPLDPFEIRTRSLDYWVITTDQGIVYYYGQTQNARENKVAWGNWIGSSFSPGGKRETIVWNVSKIQDQWNNNLQFEYDLQESTIGGVIQTEASYLKKIISSTGERIQFTYEDKNSSEYYEPHIEKSEPDAYQERYEKKALRYVDSYNSNNGLIHRFGLAYSMQDNNAPSDKKRYLQSVTQENSLGEVLPGKSFEYYTSGAFKGGLKKINYPLGGSITYTYKDQALFTNSANNYTGETINNTGYYYYAMMTKDNYVLTLYKSQTAENGKHTFKVNRSSWNGENWIENEFVFSYKITDDYPNGNNWLENFQTLFGKNYYGFLYHEGTNAKLDLFHLSPDGHNWIHTSNHFIDVDGSAPSFISGEDFVAIGCHENGKLYTYTWDGNFSWKSKVIEQNAGRFYYGGTNNFIISLNRKIVDAFPNIERDYITNAVHEDYYYIHYLNIENEWESKSWSASADPYIHGIEKASYLYPENAMSGFVPDDNPELFLRWDTNYNLLPPDNVLGEYNDQNPLITTYTGMFTLQSWFYQNPIKFARFNGSKWNVFSPTSSSAYYAKPAYGEDIMTFQNHRNNKNASYALYNPNTDEWQQSDLNSYPWYSSNNKLTSTNKEFLIAGNNIYLFPNTSRIPQQYLTLAYDNVFVHTDGIDHAFTKLATHDVNGSSASEIFKQGLYLYMNKYKDQLTGIDMGKKFHMSGPYKFAGRTPFISPNSMYLRSETSSDDTFNRYIYRIIEDKVDNLVADIVVDKVEIDNDKGEVRKTQYTFNDPSPNPSNTTTFYANVIIENKGYGSGSIGKVEKKYNNGSVDQRLTGLLLEERVKNTANATVSLKTNLWKRFNKSSRSYTIKLAKQTDTQYFNGKGVTNVVENTYTAPYYLTTNTKRTNSAGQVEESRTRYAYSQYSFMNSGNYLSQPYEITNTLNGVITSIGRTIWIKNTNNKVYASQIWSGTSTSNLRKSYEVSRINSYGQVEESNNGKNQYNTIIYGYNYRYPMISVTNTTYSNVTSNLDVSVDALQDLNNSVLKTELSKLYSKLPDSMTEITLYDDEGKVKERIDNRQERMNYFFDNFNRLDYITDHDNKIIKKNIYHYKTE